MAPLSTFESRFPSTEALEPFHQDPDVRGVIRRYDQVAARAQDSPRLSQESIRIEQVLDDVGGENEVESGLLQRQNLDRGSDHWKLIVIPIPGFPEHRLVYIECRDPGPPIGTDRRNIAGPTTRIEHVLAAEVTKKAPKRPDLHVPPPCVVPRRVVLGSLVVPQLSLQASDDPKLAETVKL
jgi:hypothetical protein